MNRRTFLLSTSAVAASVLVPTAVSGLGVVSVPQAAENDPFIWLESLESPEARQWVKGEVERTLNTLRDPQFARDEATILDLLNASDRIPAIQQRGAFLYNFWQDARHPKGVFRRTTLESYSTPTPAWETVIDLDALARTEDEDWVWRGCVSLPPQHRRGLVSLSRGGVDAIVVREFDLTGKKFVPEGFLLPEAKGR
jgi:prolyl oligopeptidase